MMTDAEIRQGVEGTELLIEPFSDDSLQPASYDLRVGSEAYVSGADSKIDIAARGLLVIDAGEFAVIATRERVRCGPQVAAQLGLSSTYARQGLTLLSGPQIDPGFDGVIVVRVTNLAPQRITLTYEAPFLTTQFFRLAHPVAHPYRGSRQGQTGLSAKDIEGLTNTDSPTLGGMVKSLTALARDVSGLQTSVARLEGSVSKLTWIIPLIVGLGIAIIGIIVAIK